MKKLKNTQALGNFLEKELILEYFWPTQKGINLNIVCKLISFGAGCVTKCLTLPLSFLLENQIYLPITFN